MKITSWRWQIATPTKEKFADLMAYAASRGVPIDYHCPDWEFDPSSSYNGIWWPSADGLHNVIDCCPEDEVTEEEFKAMCNAYTPKAE